MKTILLLLAAALLVLPQASVRAQDAGQSGENPQFQSADEYWAYILELRKGPKPGTGEGYATYLPKLEAAAQDFAGRFPDDPRRWDAKLIAAQAAGSISRMNRQPVAEANEAIESVAQEIISAPDASAATRQDARFALLQVECTTQAATPELEQDINAFSSDYPSDPRGDSLKLFFAKKMQATDPDGAYAILEQLTSSGNAQVASQAAASLKLRDIMKQPLDLRYTAVDGTEIDLSQMRGKVVLVDFWATWCGPCMGEVPNVVAAYQKYHDRGFEVVGISLDQDRDKMLRVTQEKGMTWPQYFDGKGWQNAISTSFGINSIPTMWLVNKEGVIATTQARDNLDADIEKLLEE